MLELLNNDFFIMCFAIGGAVAAVLACFVDSIPLQVITFAVATVASIFFVRPLAVKYFHHSGEHRLSNADALIGRIGKVTERIEAGGYGRVQVDGDYWKAEAKNAVAIEEGMSVRIIKLDSIIATVEIA